MKSNLSVTNTIHILVLIVLVSVCACARVHNRQGLGSSVYPCLLLSPRFGVTSISVSAVVTQASLDPAQ